MGSDVKSERGMMGLGLKEGRMDNLLLHEYSKSWKKNLIESNIFRERVNSGERGYSTIISGL